MTDKWNGKLMPLSPFLSLPLKSISAIILHSLDLRAGAHGSLTAVGFPLKTGKICRMRGTPQARCVGLCAFSPKGRDSGAACRE